MNNNKSHYNKQYADQISIKYKTNTRWLLSLVDELMAEIETVESILDVGCGSGIITAALKEKYLSAHVIGVDLSDVGIVTAEEIYSSVEGLDFMCADATNNEFLHKIEEKIELLTLFEVIEHIEDWERVLGKLLNTYESKYVIISTPIGRMRDYEINVGHYRNYQKGEVERYMESHGYKTMKFFYAGFPFWSPICRDLLNIFRKNAVNVQKKCEDGMTLFEKIASQFLYFLFKYLSMKNKGDQFVALFVKEDLV